MQYISIGNDDLKSGYRTFLLKATKEGVNFSAYAGEAALNADKESQRKNAYLARYFLRKGFTHAIENVDPNVIEPIYRTPKGEGFTPLSTNEAISLIFDDKLTVSEFRFKENITDRQRDEEFGKLINSFVSTSKNADFSSDKNLFCIQNGFEVEYNNGGSKDVMIDSVDIQEKLGLNTVDTIARELRNQAMNDGGLIDDELYGYDADLQQTSKYLKRDLEDVKTGSNEEKLKFITNYGWSFHGNLIDESALSKETYEELSSLVKNTFEANKDKFKDDDGTLLFTGTTILEHCNYRENDNLEMNSKNAMALVDMFKHCGKNEVKSFDQSFMSCGNITADAAHYVLNNVDDPQSIKDVILAKSPDYKKQVENIRNKKNELKQRLANKKDTDGISGVVIADKIAEGIQSGVIVDTVTPEKGNKMAENIRGKLLQKSR